MLFLYDLFYFEDMSVTHFLYETKSCIAHMLQFKSIDCFLFEDHFKA